MLKIDTHLATLAYQHILKKIITLEIRPGARIQERTLAEEMDMSRTPVREALNRLAQESWVKINARRNIEVRDLDANDVHGLFAVRKVLEVRGVDYIITNNLCREATTAMEAALERMRLTPRNDYEFNKADIEFHEVLALADNNRYFSEFWRRIILENARMGLVAFEFFEKNTGKVCLEHSAILEGLQKKSKKNVKAALVKHLDGVMHAILASLKLEDVQLPPEDDIYRGIYQRES